VGKMLDWGWHHEMVQGVRSFSIEDYQQALIILPICLLIGLLILFFIRETYQRV
jgi:hypothetical protein